MTTEDHSPPNPPPPQTPPPPPPWTGALAEVEEALKHKQAEAKSQDRMLSEVVGPEDIATVVSKWTGVPVQKLQASARGGGAGAQRGEGARREPCPPLSTLTSPR